MPRVTNAAKDKARRDSDALKVCSCRHLVMEHHEVYSKPQLVDGVIIPAERLSPSGMFPCDLSDCDCADVDYEGRKV